MHLPEAICPRIVNGIHENRVGHAESDAAQNHTYRPRMMFDHLQNM